MKHKKLIILGFILLVVSGGAVVVIGPATATFWLAVPFFVGLLMVDISLLCQPKTS